MNAAHAHLILNHFPVIGVIFAIGISVYVLFRQEQAVFRVALFLLVVSGALSLPVYLTGESSEELVEEVGAGEQYIEVHEEAAKVAAISTGALGILALVSLWWFRQREIGRMFVLATLVLGMVVGGLLTYTGYAGGKIMHTEIHSGSPSGPGASYSDDD